MHAAVDSLPEREREVIELAYFSGLSQSEVAERLSLPLGTVKTRTRSGLARLAERLAMNGWCHERGAIHQRDRGPAARGGCASDAACDHLQRIARAEALGPTADVVDIRSAVAAQQPGWPADAGRRRPHRLGRSRAGDRRRRQRFPRRPLHEPESAARRVGSAVVDIGSLHRGPVRDVQMHVNGLRPAPKGGYYELWMRMGRATRLGWSPSTLRGTAAWWRTPRSPRTCRGRSAGSRSSALRQPHDRADPRLAAKPVTSAWGHYTRKGVARGTTVPPYRGAVYPSPKEMYMKNRLTRSAYLLALLAAFVWHRGQVTSSVT